mgnify:CR=1 FL=1
MFVTNLCDFLLVSALQTEGLFPGLKLGCEKLALHIYTYSYNYINIIHMYILIIDKKWREMRDFFQASSCRRKMGTTSGEGVL